MTDAASDDALAGLLGGWIVTQRWFGGKGRPLARLRLETVTELACPGARLVHTVLQVHYRDATVERYQVPVTLRADEPGELGHAFIGRLGDATVYDALRDPAGTAGLLELLAAAESAGGRRSVGALEAFAVEPVKADGEARPVGAEQSNTSVVYGSSVILKAFRRLAPGENPDVEITRALAGLGCPAVIRPLAWADGPVAGEPTTLLLLQPFVTNATDGWKLATASVRDLYAEADLHADEVGGDFAAESHRLGVATAEVHRSLAQALGSRTATPAQLAATLRDAQTRLAEAATTVPALARHAPAVAAAFDAAFDAAALARRDRPISVQRVHGDFHLGQVLRGPDRWLLVDFEGEPVKPLSERTRPASPLRDVAGMLRSFDYAARTLLSDHPGASGLAYRATEWADRNRAAFCAGYGQVAGSDPRTDATLLRAFELDKAVYEVVYEARNRPSWLPIPMGAIERLTS